MAVRSVSKAPAEVFILGAGFSRAVHGPMPTVADLGRAIAARLLASPEYAALISERLRVLLTEGRVPTGNVELWLSSLAERQPFETRSQALQNQALFDEITLLIVDLVRDLQKEFWRSAPGWLHRLVRLWHRRRPTILTFNYDTIVEQAMENLDAPGADGDIVGAMLASIPRLAVQTQWGSLPAKTFRLLKLHGSLDWFWNPDDRSGDSLVRASPSAPEHDLRAALAGKVPFVVPPLATKALFYSLSLVQEIWQEAARALASTDKVIVAGYSVPMTDLATAAMISRASQNGVDWRVVNPDAAAVRDRLVQVGIPVDAIATDAAISEWVNAYEWESCGKMSEVLKHELDSFRSPTFSTLAPIMVRRSRSDYGTIVRAIRTDGTRIVLEAHERNPQTVIPEDYPHEPDLASTLGRVDPPGPVFVQIDGLAGEHLVLGALDPVPLRGAGAVPYWCAVEIQDVVSTAGRMRQDRT